MSKPKKRWAWKARHKRPKFKSLFDRPDDTRQLHQWAQRLHRSHTRKALVLIRQGEDESNVTFPYHHHHWLKWWWE